MFFCFANDVIFWQQLMSFNKQKRERNYFQQQTPNMADEKKPDEKKTEEPKKKPIKFNVSNLQLLQFDRHFEAQHFVLGDPLPFDMKDNEVGYKVGIGYKDPKWMAPFKFVVELPPACWTFGVQNSVVKETGRHFGYSLPLILWSNESSSDDVEKGKLWNEKFVHCISMLQQMLKNQMPELLPPNNEWLEQSFSSFKRPPDEQNPDPSPITYVNLKYFGPKIGVKTILTLDGKKCHVDELIGKKKMMNVKGVMEFDVITLLPKKVTINMVMYEAHFQTRDQVSFFQPGKKKTK
jgi:hypothetical protein